MTFRRYKEGSRADWGVDLEDGRTLTAEQIQMGAVLRIADATEAMAKNYVRIQEERDRFERYYKDEQRRRASAERSNAALRGHIKRIKRLAK